MNPTGKQDALSFSLIIPCYNESNRINALIQGLESFGQQFKYPYEIIIVDDGSTDNTVAILEESAFAKKNAGQLLRIVKNKTNHGKGAALKSGVAQASKEYILTLDADLSTLPQQLNSFTKHIASNKILIGSREHKESSITSDKARKNIGRIFNFFVRFLTPLTYKDTQCGFKLYPAVAAKKIFADLKTSGWAHDVEVLYRARLLGYIIEDLPITWKSMEGSKINVLRDSLKMFIEILRISLMMHVSHLFVDPFRSESRKNDSLFRGIFSMLSLVLILMMAYLSFDYGITGDDMDQKVYGEHVLDFYTTLGKDTSCLHLKIGNKENLHLYGGLFPMLSAALNRYVGGIDEYDMRHLLNAVAGASAIVFTGLLTYAISGSWLAACLSLLILSLWPQFFGHSMNNPKDIPFALGYVMTIYYLTQWIKQLPKPDNRIWIKMALAIAFTINIRVGGLILMGMMISFYLGSLILSGKIRTAVTSSKQMSSHIKKMLIVSVVAYFLGLLFWPYGLLGPLSNPFTALKESTNFSMPIGLFFEGKMMTSKDIPWYYVPKWLWITTPVITLMSSMFFGALWFLMRKQIPVERTLLLAFSALFPWAYAVYSHSAMYDAMRQMLFLVPLLAVMASLSWYYLISRFSNQIVRYAIVAILFIGLIPPARFSLANHPNQYVYFNEISGGIDKAWLQYDTDYYMNSIKQTATWFKQSDMFKNAGPTNKIRLATNTLDPINHYFKNDTDKVKVIYTKWYSPGHEKSRANRDWDYGIYNSRTVDPAQLKYGIWPSDKTIYASKADGVPLSVVIARKNKSDYEGYLAMKKDSTLLAERLYTDALQENKQNEEVYINLIQIKLGLKKYQDVIQLARQWQSVNPENDMAYVYEGIASAYGGNFESALNQLLRAIQINPDNYQAYSILAQLYNQKGDKQNAQYYYNKSEEVKQKLQGQ